MNEKKIQALLRTDKLRIQLPDLKKALSLVRSSERCVAVAKRIPLSDESATLVFREIYEAIRQLGEAKWWVLGYEPRNHQVSLGVLEDMNIQEKNLLHLLPRFRKIRNNANYQGTQVSVAQVKKILDFWERCGSEITQLLLSELETPRTV